MSTPVFDALSNSIGISTVLSTLGPSEFWQLHGSSSTASTVASQYVKHSTYTKSQHILDTVGNNVFSV